MEKTEGYREFIERMNRTEMDELRKELYKQTIINERLVKGILREAIKTKDCFYVRIPRDYVDDVTKEQLSKKNLNYAKLDELGRFLVQDLRNKLIDAGEIEE